MNYSEPKVTIDLKEYQALLDSQKELKEQEGKQPLSDEQIYKTINFIFQSGRGSITGEVLHKKLSEIGVRMIDVAETNYSFKLRPL